MPLLLQIDPSVLDLDVLRRMYEFEIVSEHEDGYVIVASEDVDLLVLQAKISEFASGRRGSATVASIHRLFDDPTQDDRLKRVLSESLYQSWSTIKDDQVYICDLGIGGLGTHEIPKLPKRGSRDTDAEWARKEADWATARANVYETWDDLQRERSNEIRHFVERYGGERLDVVDELDNVEPGGRLPDSVTVRIRISGKGLRDLVLSYPYLFEVTEPDDIDLPQWQANLEGQSGSGPEPLPPAMDAPAVCVIDSGIQEGHRLIAPAIDVTGSRCFVPGMAHHDVADLVAPGGHGTRVAGAVLYGETVPLTGSLNLEFWVQNARILDDQSHLPVALFPPSAIRQVVEYYNDGPRTTRIFNHSINALTPCRLLHMSAWAAEIDALSEERDVLIVQSAGNIRPSQPGLVASNPSRLSVAEHLAAGRDYPAYLDEPACRIANPAQSLQALTVGSIAYGAFEDMGWRSFAPAADHPSAFSRSGPGIWNVIKPEVVEYGGDLLRTFGPGPQVGTPSQGHTCYPELIRSTQHGPGPAYDRDEVGTSYAAPKVARIAARLQQVLPAESTLLYRALIVQSARWPEWTSNLDNSRLLAVLRRLGYGIPHLERATSNTEHRTTLVASRDPNSPDQDLRIKAGECHLFQVPIPQAMRNVGTDYDILVEVTLSYAARPRRTRRTLRHYLSTWVDWKSSKLGEPIGQFRERVMKEDAEEESVAGASIPWTIGERSDWGRIHGAKRVGTVHKDWAIVKSHQLPEDFGIAIVGHKGWSQDPDSSARYALAVSFDVLGKEITIHEEIRQEVERLKTEVEIEAEVAITTG
jgi:hypothetical protein